MRKIIIITDIHLRSSGRDIIGLYPLKQLEKALIHAKKAHPDAEHLILMGDLTHSGHAEEFEMLKAAVTGYPIPITYMLGNHDKRNNFIKTFSNIPLARSGHLQTRIELGNDVLLCLDTLDGPPYPENQHNGILCKDRLAWLNEELDKSINKRVSLFMHHPPHNIGFPGMDKIKLKNSSDLFKIISQNSNICHIFTGHVHRTISGHTNGVGFSIFKSTCHQTPMALDSDDDSLSVPDPAAYGIILFDDQSIIAHTEDYEIAIQSSSTSLDAMPD